MENENERRESLKILEKVGWKHGLLDKLATNQERGIIGDVKDLKRRQDFFGKNTRSLPHVRSFWSVLLDQFDEKYVFALLVIACISFGVSFFIKGQPNKYVESITIFVAVIFAGLIQTLCDWGKDRQFLRLRAEIMNEKVTVSRGQGGYSQQVLVSDLVVGDVITLTAGDRVPADCILVDEMDMFVDQSIFDPRQTRVEKQCSFNNPELDSKVDPDNVLLQDSLVVSGYGKAVVLAVGENTRKEMSIDSTSSSRLMIESKPTPMQDKLQVLVEICSFYAYVVLGVALSVFVAIWFIRVCFTDMGLVSGKSIKELLDYFGTAVALLIACIPEGMPLVISMAMAFSVDALKKDNLLVKNLDALETSGQIFNVLTGKTATLTTGDLTAVKLHICGRTVDAGEPQTSQAVLQALQRSVILNSSVRMQMGLTQYKPEGSPVEVGLVNMLLAQGAEVHSMVNERELIFNKRLVIPFSSDRRRMTVCYEVPELPGEVLVVVKGAPEYVVPLCQEALEDDGSTRVFAEVDAQEFIESIVPTDLVTKDGNKPLVIAQKTVSLEEFGEWMERYNKFEAEGDRGVLESGLTFVAGVSLEDPLRIGVKDSIEMLFNGETNVRLITGDCRETAVRTAINVEIIADQYDEAQIMSSDDLLKEMFEMMDLAKDPETAGTKYVFKSPAHKDAFRKQIYQQVSVVYRATPETKLMLTSAFKIFKRIVAVTGEALADSDAIKEADVGFVMGEDGCSVARDSADVILMQDEFDTVVSAIRWGRNMQDNVRKFVQFQLTMSMSVIFIVLLSTFTLTHSAFNVIQILWINLIMDVLAAIAFATETPHPSQIRKERIKGKDPIMTPVMWRSIFSQVLYQAIVMTVILYFGPAMAGIKYNFYHAEFRNSEGEPTYRMLHMTWMFHCYVMMNLFNMINCRVLGRNPPPEQVDETGSLLHIQGRERSAGLSEFNIFQRLFSNWWFLIILLIELNLQFLMTGSATVGALFMTTPMTFGMHLTAVLLGVGSWIVAAIAKKTPPGMLKLFESLKDDESVASDIQRRKAQMAKRMDVVKPRED